MHRPQVVRAGWVSLCLLTLVTVSFSQTSPSVAPLASPSPNPSPSPQIIYTGKLLGYFRVPAGQTRDAFARCHAQAPATDLSLETSTGNDSKAATGFLEQRAMNPGAILVGTGDNFAPQLEAREFNPADRKRGPDPYTIENKELYYGDGDGWVFFRELNKHEALKSRVAAGIGTIPTDNVGCFLYEARFAAIVPGKHDFYFGAERVRQLARFMAGLPHKEKAGPSAKETGELPEREKYVNPPQMLGANLVIKTVAIDGQVTRPDLRSKPWFTAEWPKQYQPNISEGGSVYPWFSNIHIKVMEFKRQSSLLVGLLAFLNGRPETEPLLVEFADKMNAQPASKDTAYTEELKTFSDAVKDLLSKTVYVCRSKGDPNELEKPYDDKCAILERKVRLAGNNVVYDLPVDDPKLVDPDQAIDPDPKPTPKDKHFSTLTPARNYGLCLMRTGDQPKDGKEPNTNCIRFSVHTPFFYYPYSRPTATNYYTDPDPFVLLDDKSRPYEVAIFGVVDPHLGEQVGILNFSWLNQDDKLKTIVSAEDPAQALREQLEYFQRWYGKTHKGQQFSGLKILLAQASPERARVFATVFPEFQVVVTAADDQQGTSETTLRTVWSRQAKASSFVAVPIPYYDGAKQQGIVHFGSILVSPQANSWELSSYVIKPKPIEPTKSAGTEFWQQIGGTLSQCLPDGPAPTDKPTGLDRIKWLTLCAMRDQTNADVALLQKRDFFDQLPFEAADAPDNVQQILNRLIWKGDLLTLIYVPGSALKKALQQSKSYEAEESSALSVLDERWRKLEMLGITYKSATREYLINEVPIDDKKIYAVATSDYLGAGDTGYPDLAAAALNPRTHAAAFPKELNAISSVVCRKLYPDQAEQLCLREIARDDYLDESLAKRTIPYREPGFGKKLWDLFPFKWPPKSEPAMSTSAALQEKVQHRPFWTFSLKNFSLGYSSLSNNLSDADIDTKFAGVSTSGVTAHKTHTVTMGLDTRLTRSSHRNEFFLSTTIDYQEQSTGDVAPQINQINNRLTGEAGLIFNVRGGRSQSRVGISLSLHAERPLQRPFTNFKLGTGDRLKITQDRGLLLLPRFGLRWQNRSNSLELGAEVGEEINALNGYRFVTKGSPVECLPNATETFANCITRLSKAPLTAIAKDSVATAILDNRRRAGFYWKSSLSIPFGAKVKYELKQEADFFFNFHEDNTSDTRYRDLSKHSLKFMIWPSFSIGPTLQLLLYQNKVKRDFLFQKKFGLEANFSFDLFNPREKSVQLKHKP
jgi:hypothetical protein